MWRGTPRQTVRAALPLLEPTDSPAWHDLARRLLLSGAVAPAGPDPRGEPSLALLRARRLADLGMLAGAATVLRSATSDTRDEAIAHFAIELDFAVHDLADACREIGAEIIHYRNVWWDRAQIACQILDGDREKAARALEILHDRDEPPDTSFDALAAAAEGHRATLERDAKLTPLGATLWAVGKRPLPDAIVAAADAGTLAAFAGSPDEPAVNRLVAAERAAALGVWPADRLARLYRAAAQDRATRLADPKLGDTPRGRAVLFAVAETATDPVARADALRRFLEAAGRHDLGFVASRLAAPIIVAIPPGDPVKGAAADFVRALVAADRPQAIAPWAKLADPAEIGPLVTIARVIEGGDAMPDPAAISEALAALALRKSDAAPHQIAMFLALADAFGATLSPDELTAGMTPDHRAAMPSLALWLDQRAAAAAHRLGETVLTSLVMASSDGQLTQEPIALRLAIGGLRAVGLDGDARAMALEAAVAAGL
jgi:hypothetical protein